MPLNNSSNFQIHGGTFYDVSGNVNVETHQQFSIQDDRLQARYLPHAGGSQLEGSTLGTHVALEGHAFAGATRNARNAGTKRMVPYGTSSRRSIPSRSSPPIDDTRVPLSPNRQGTDSSFFREARNAPPVQGGTFITTSGSVNHIQRHADNGIMILHRAVALDALFDSADSFPQPKCHPETREKMLDMLWRWATKSDRHKHILWLSGPAGAGKSAIIQTLCQRLQAAGFPSASFFFKRGHATRGNAKVLFATLAYQLALHHPDLKTSISLSAEDDPSVVGRTTNVQLQKLVVEPCQSLQHPAFAPILLVDGLDEGNNQELQQDVLRSIGNAFREHLLPFKVLIASRPEPHIQEIFESSCLKGLYHTVNINQSFADIEKYLRDEFARIHREHGQTMRAVPTPWPSSQTIDNLVSKSSGYFIYASTIIKFIDDKNFRPTERLAMVENIGVTDDLDGASPFEALDQLYIQILSSVPSQRRLLAILSVMMEFSALSVCHIEQLLELQPGDVDLALRGLHSVLEIPPHPSRPIVVHHASFRDFLADSTRSGAFHVSGLPRRTDLAGSILKAMAYMPIEYSNLIA
ncbi:hypothetical protein C8R44DRAFT_395436 [Mycena epipterygia]|nr:hypothetical protein C8R44DRAFT_395436 [Mycena epipterygia]